MEVTLVMLPLWCSQSERRITLAGLFKIKTMTITVTDFERITGISRHTVYAWFYRGNFPDGIKSATSLGTTKLLKVNSKSEHYGKISKQLT